MDWSANMDLERWWVKPSIPALLPNSLRATPDAYRGCLLGGAIGDALGRPMEGKSLERIRSIFPGEVREFIPHRRWMGGPEGTFTDDTEMTLCIAESYLENGRLVPEDLSMRFEAWELVGRGRGHTCIAACENLRRGLPWYESGVSSAGNGAAMRAAPVGLANPTDTAVLVHDAAISTVITHRDPMAVASSVAQAFLVARLVNSPFGTLDVSETMSELSTLLDRIDDQGHPERKPDASGQPVRLVDRILFVASSLDWSPDRLFAMTHNGAFVLESLPAAIWCFLRTPEDPERVIVTAANMGYDADTVAAMAGNLAGAYVGESSLPTRWLDSLEYADGIRDIADGLLALAGGTSPEVGVEPSPTPSRVGRFEGEFGFLSNFSRGPFTFEGRRYPTAEHAYQAAKALDPNDAERIRLLPTPWGARVLGNGVTMRPGWDDLRLGIMERILRAKFKPGTRLADMLAATGSAELIEGNWWGDTFWGKVDGVGQNRLGRLLMGIRAEVAPVATVEGVAE
jgi:ribA/ribD-fused uncharacterized protein